MKCRPGLFLSGALLMALVPVTMLWQSSNTSRGTSRGYSNYNVDHLGTIITESIFVNGDPETLNLLCDYTLERDGNLALTVTWIDYVRHRFGDCYPVRLARGRACAFAGDYAGMRREFSAALSLASNDEERARVMKALEQGGRR